MYIGLYDLIWDNTSIFHYIEQNPVGKIRQACKRTAVNTQFFNYARLDLKEPATCHSMPQPLTHPQKAWPRVVGLQVIKPT